MTRCPACGAQRNESDDYCPVCGETLTEVHLSEATGSAWYERTGTLVGLAVVFWPVAIYGLFQRPEGRRASDLLVLCVCLAMAYVWSLLF